MPEREYKSMPTYSKAVGDRVVEGILAVIGNVDDGRDRIAPGAFIKTIAENRGRVRHLWMHNSYEPPIAKILELREVGASELPKELIAAHPTAVGGLYVKREYLDTPRANEVFTGIKAGVIDEGSIGYDSIKWDYERQGDVPIRVLREVRLWDTSDVTWGMNPATANLKFAGVGTDIQSLLTLADGFKAGRVLSAANLDMLKQAIASLTEILRAAEPSTDDAQASPKALTELIEGLKKRSESFR